MGLAVWLVPSLTYAAPLDNWRTDRRISCWTVVVFWGPVIRRRPLFLVVSLMVFGDPRRPWVRLARARELDGAHHPLFVSCSLLTVRG